MLRTARVLSRPWLVLIVAGFAFGIMALATATSARFASPADSALQFATTRQSSPATPQAVQAVFTNSTPILIPSAPTASPSPASPYPSTISVSGLGTALSGITVTFNGFHHTQQKDVDAVLIGPTGASLIIMSDNGGAISDSTVINLTFDDAAAANAPITAIGATGTYKPSNNSVPDTGDNWPGASPAGPYNSPAPTGSATFASTFIGTNPNGNWKLYVFDDVGGDIGAFNGGWTLTLTTAALTATTTTVQSSLNPALTTDSFALTAHVVETTGGANVTTGSVTFFDNSTGVTLASNVALNGSGLATTPTISGQPERRHTISATYNPGATFLTSVGTFFQTVDFPTTNPSTGVYANTNSVTIPDPASSTGPGGAVQYPSHITVSGLSGIVSNVAVSLKNVTHGAAGDLDVLLIGPGGQNLVLLSDTGGNTSNVSVSFDDTSPTSLPTSGPWAAPGTSLTSKPIDGTAGGSDSWPTPAPASGYNHAAPEGSATLSSSFGATNPNGVWSLYIYDDAGGDAGAMAGGWSLTFTLTSTVTWNGVSSANWATATNWTPNATPSSLLDAVIPAGALPNEPAISAADVTVNNLTVGTGHTLTVNSGRTLTVGGTATVNGNFGGSGGIFSFNNLTIGNAGGITLGGNAAVNGVLALTSGDLNMGGNTLTQPPTPASTGTFDVIGAVKRSNGGSPLPLSTALTFGNPNNRLTFTAGTRPTEVTMTLVKSAPATFISAVQRNYTITPSAVTAFTAMLRLHYLDSELNGNTPESSLNLRRFNGTGWAPYPPTTPVDTGNNWVENNAVQNFSQWTFSKLAPTAAGGVVTGRIVDDHGNAVEGAVVRLSGAQNRKFITDANGVYRFENVAANGFYTVTPSRANYTFNPAVRSFSQIGETTEAGFGATLLSSGFVNPLDTPEYFVRQHYLDFLGREPDEAGFNFWSDQILECGGDSDCVQRRRENVSAAYFLSIEFQQTGGLVDGLYRASYGVSPQYAAFMPDTRTVGAGVRVGNEGWETTLRNNKEAFVNAFVNRAEFRTAFDNLSNEDYVATLIGHTNVSFTAAERDELIGSLGTGQMTRAEALRSIAENGRFVDAKRNQMFVMMEYMGYLRRDPDASGYAFWLNKLNQFNGNFEQADMVKAFIVSGEYRDRFPE